MSEENKRKLVIDDKEYNYDELKQEQQILMDHVENCRRQKANLAFQIDRENVAESAFAKMLEDSFKEDQEDQKEKEDA
jgi:hypothetical protein|tara:strand:- start:215 stop:448 length:234 start_codon:yes stop_codon:yes gene_type:complete